LTLYALWEYTISYDLKGGADNGYDFSPQKKRHNVALTLPSGKPRHPANNAFIGWASPDGKRVEAGGLYNGNDTVTLSAVWGYTVILDPNGGYMGTPYFSNAIAAVTVAFGDKVFLPLANTVGGYAFLGWFSSGGVRVGPTGSQYTLVDDYAANGMVYLYAHWRSNDITYYTVNYYANGGTVSPDSETVAAGTSVYLPYPSKSGSSCTGWFTPAGGKVGNPGDSYPVNFTTTLSAQWTAGGSGTTYTVTFNPNGGTVSPASQTVAAGTPVTLPTPSKSGSSCTGWYTAASGGSKVGDAGAYYTVNATTTIYAQWGTAPSGAYTISYNLNGGTYGPFNGSSYFYDQTTNSSGQATIYTTQPYRLNYTFMGWSEYANGDAQYLPNTVYKFNKNIVIYAVWARDSMNLEIKNLPPWDTLINGTNHNVWVDMSDPNATISWSSDNPSAISVTKNGDAGAIFHANSTGSANISVLVQGAGSSSMSSPAGSDMNSPMMAMAGIPGLSGRFTLESTPKSVESLADAVDVLYRKGIISSSQYWLDNSDKAPYFELLLKKIADALNRLYTGTSGYLNGVEGAINVLGPYQYNVPPFSKYGYNIIDSPNYWINYYKSPDNKIEYLGKLFWKIANYLSYGSAEPSQKICTSHSYITVNLNKTENHPNHIRKICSNCGDVVYENAFSSECDTCKYEILLSVAPVRQETTNTCGSACGRMLLSKFGIDVTEASFKAQVESHDTDYTMVWAIAASINDFFGSTRYQYTYIGGYTETQFRNLIVTALKNGYPLQLPLKITDTNHFKYTSTGHYLLIKGINLTTDTLLLNDPHYNIAYPTTIDVPLSAVKSYNIAHSGFIINPV